MNVLHSNVLTQRHSHKHARIRVTHVIMRGWPRTGFCTLATKFVYHLPFFHPHPLAALGIAAYSLPLQLHLCSTLCLLQIIVKLFFSLFWQSHHTCPNCRALQVSRQAQWRPIQMRWIGSTTRLPRSCSNRPRLSPVHLIDETIKTSQRIGCSRQAVQVFPAPAHMILVPHTSNLLSSHTAISYKYRRKQTRAR